MKTLEFKRSILFVTLFSFIATVAIAQNDPDFQRLKSVTRLKPINKVVLPGKIVLAKNNKLFHISPKAAIPFKPFELKDKQGKPIAPNTVVTLKNGKKMSAQEYLDKLNDIEKDISQRGYTLRNNDGEEVAKFNTDVKFLHLDMKSSAIAPRLQGTALHEYGNVAKTMGAAFAYKPVEQYSPAEKKAYSGMNYSDLQKRINAGSLTNKINPKIAANQSNQQLNVIDEDNPKNWTFGDPSLISVGFDLDFKRHIEIYSKNTANPAANMTGVDMTGTADINASLFDHSLKIFEAKGTLHAPADLSKKLITDISVTVASEVIYDRPDSEPQQLTWSDYQGKSFDQSANITIPIYDGLNFEGRIGIQGDVGFGYNFTLDRRPAATFEVTPEADLSAYAEVGVNFVDIAEIGVGGNLTVFKGSMDLYSQVALSGLYVPGPILLGYTYNIGYKVNFMSGNIYVFGELCDPTGITGFFGLPSCIKKSFTIFSWGGFSDQGTLAQDTYISVLSNN